jgi:hypothetical protein
MLARSGPRADLEGRMSAHRRRRAARFPRRSPYPAAEILNAKPRNMANGKSSSSPRANHQTTAVATNTRRARFRVSAPASVASVLLVANIAGAEPAASGDASVLVNVGPLRALRQESSWHAARGLRGVEQSHPRIEGTELAGVEVQRGRREDSRADDRGPLLRSSRAWPSFGPF